MNCKKPHIMIHKKAGMSRNFHSKPYTLTLVSTHSFHIVALDLFVPSSLPLAKAPI